MASPALYRHGLLSKITLKKVIPSRPDSKLQLAATTESDRITGLLACRTLPYERSGRSPAGIQTQPSQADYSMKPPSRYRVYSCELTDLSRMRERDPLVLQHK